ncbi:hypothetical protein [Curtobacterium sp. MCPF17_021]|uniref:hypothetical protein n=1 Tax=Curtobacterium sp. MCPF17_021 TaxID=2175639 RepID=UPI0015E8E176|nr:hypothetical protein [Curtobacterium sp. MCPF17_021]WIE83224.1 hypothetical protein DEJ29_017835 [Curtobacterium sp. MCPF17_021]
MCGGNIGGWDGFVDSCCTAAGTTSEYADGAGGLLEDLNAVALELRAVAEV